MYAARSGTDSKVVVNELALGRIRRPLANGPAALGPTPVAPLQSTRFIFTAVRAFASPWSQNFAVLPAGSIEVFR
jgi:hypothetical protein